MRKSHLILLVENDPHDALLAQTAFANASLNLRLFVVPDGEQAVQYLKGEAIYADRSRFALPNLILLNLHTPGMCGFEVLGWLRKRPGVKHLPVVVLADCSSHMDLNRAYGLGADSFLHKPSDAHSFTLLFRQLADRWLHGHGRRMPAAPPFLPSAPLPPAISPSKDSISLVEGDEVLAE